MYSPQKYSVSVAPYPFATAFRSDSESFAVMMPYPS